MIKSRVRITWCDEPDRQLVPDRTICAFVFCTLDDLAIEPLLVGYEKAELVAMPVSALHDPAFDLLLGVMSGPTVPITDARITDDDWKLIRRTVLDHVRRVQNLAESQA